MVLPGCMVGDHPKTIPSEQAAFSIKSSVAGVVEVTHVCALLQTVSTIFSAMDVHGWLTFNEFVQIVEVCAASSHKLHECAV